MQKKSGGQPSNPGWLAGWLCCCWERRTGGLFTLGNFFYGCRAVWVGGSNERCCRSSPPTNSPLPGGLQGRAWVASAAGLSVRSPHTHTHTHTHNKLTFRLTTCQGLLEQTTSHCSSQIVDVQGLWPFHSLLQLLGLFEESPNKVLVACSIGHKGTK